MTSCHIGPNDATSNIPNSCAKGSGKGTSAIFRQLLKPNLIKGLSWQAHMCAVTQQPVPAAAITYCCPLCNPAGNFAHLNSKVMLSPVVSTTLTTLALAQKCFKR